MELVHLVDNLDAEVLPLKPSKKCKPVVPSGLQGEGDLRLLQLRLFEQIDESVEAGTVAGERE